MQLFNGNCLEVMTALPDKSIDFVLCDLPYGVTSCTWDSIIDIQKLWKEWKRLTSCVILTATQPFATALINSNPKQFRYDLVWSKGKGSNPLLANKRPMRSHESVLIFGKPPVYNPQMTEGKPYNSPRTGGTATSGVWRGPSKRAKFRQATKDTSKRFPLSILEFSLHCGSKFHPTQKPVALMEYLIKTYSNPGMTILDNCMGSGTTGVACINTSRDFIGIELDPNYFAIASERILDAQVNRAMKQAEVLFG